MGYTCPSNNERKHHVQNSQYAPTIRACVENGNRLLRDAEYLSYDDECSATSFVLCLLAQEEFAKAFLLHLVANDVIPWSSFVRRAMRDHSSKHLLCVVMEFLNPDTDEFLRRAEEFVNQNYESQLPHYIADSINILRHEKIGRWQSSTWFWAEEPVYDDIAKRVANGHIDHQKQDALYVGIGKVGEVTSNPKTVTREQMKIALDQATRIGQLVAAAETEKMHGLEYSKIESAFKALFADVRPAKESITNRDSA
jgi:AbiV family abortive infection protein